MSQKIIDLWEGNAPLYNGEANPTFEFYPAQNKKGRGTVVICPGGAYWNHANHEGKNYAEFLNDCGLDVFVLYYRVASTHNKFPSSLLDARRAIRYVRANAEKYGIDPEKIAIMGSSAGGHLAALTSTYKKPIDGEGVDELRDFIYSELIDKTTAFSGASGVGKSTLMNMLFPTLSLETGNISRKIERGKHTTRSVELYSLENDGKTVYIADTPGFSMLDFKNFDFFSKDDLPYTFREFVPLIGQCKYTKCSHTKEDGCEILARVKRGEIEKTRHQSYAALYEILKKKPTWKK